MVIQYVSFYKFTPIAIKFVYSSDKMIISYVYPALNVDQNHKNVFDFVLLHDNS